MSLAKAILVIEDDPDALDAIGMVLEHAGYGVVPAGNGLEALALVAAGLRPDLILLDLNMPKMDGPSFVGTLRRQAPEVTAPIVLLSGERDLHRHVADLQLAGHLTKPVKLDALLAMVRQTTES